MSHVVNRFPPSYNQEISCVFFVMFIPRKYISKKIEVTCPSMHMIELSGGEK
jgi:hypothetical protein